MKYERLGIICNLRNGYAFKSEQFEETGVPIIRISDINGNFVRSEKAVRIKYIQAFENFKIENGDLLIAMSGATTGKYGIYSSEEFGYQNQRVGCFIIKDEKKLSKSYLLQVLRFLKPLIERKAHGSGQPNISDKDIEELEIPVPSLPDQLHIAKLLSKAENLISQRKESIRLLDEFLKSTFLEMFGDPGANPKNWNIDKLENTFLNKPLIGSMVPAIENGTIPIVRVGELGKREIDFKKCKFSNLNKKDLEKYCLKNGDILLARAIGSLSHLGKASIFTDKGKIVVYDSHVMRIRFNYTIIHPEYFYTFLQTKGGRKRFMQKGGQTSVQFNINSKQISDIDIPIPPLELQTQFAQIVEKTEGLKTQYQQSFQELENLYGSLSQKAFRGELTLKSMYEPEIEK